MPNKTQAKHEAIRTKFTDLVKKKGLRSNVAVSQIAQTLFMEESTIQAIVYQKGRYKVCE